MFSYWVDVTRQELSQVAEKADISSSELESSDESAVVVRWMGWVYLADELWWIF